MAVRRTPEQEAVVKNRGGGLLVSAAAGSGKTRVLVERLLDRILTEGKNVDQFLIITFTRAAAEELRARIAKEIAEALAGQPDNAHLRRQTALLYKAQISTIHAFCTVLLRQWGHLLDLPADFALCEDEEAQVLMARTLDQVLEARYETIDPEGDFARLLDVLAAGRDDSRLVEIRQDPELPRSQRLAGGAAGGPGPHRHFRRGPDPLGSHASPGGRPDRRILGHTDGQGLLSGVRGPGAGQGLRGQSGRYLRGPAHLCPGR